MGVVFDDNQETPRRLQELARHKFVCKMLAEIVADTMICEIEGWDKTEFILLLHAELNEFARRIRGGNDE